MSKAIANLDDLKRMQGSVRRAEDQIDQAIRQLKSDLARADWKDDRRRDFESQLNDATSSVQRAKQQLGQLQPILNKAIQDLSTYLQR